MIIISAIEPAKLNLDLLIENKSENNIIYQGKFGQFVYLLKSDRINTWKNSVRSFLKQKENEFLFLGHGKNITNNNYSGCIISGHVNLSGENPLIGKNADKFGPRFFDVGDLYSEKLRKKIFKNNNKFLTDNILIPKKIDDLTELEKRVLNLSEISFAALTRDVFAGALIAKHGNAATAGLVLFQDSFDLNEIINFAEIS